MKTTDFIIIGGGAAGMAAAITAARNGQSVVLLESNDRIGKKILVSGNGKCNIGNRHITLGHFHSNNPTFIQKALAGNDYEYIETFFSSLGLSLTEGKDGQMFPLSLQASSVVSLLIHEAEQLGIEVITNCTVMGIQKVESFFTITTSKGAMKGTKILLSSGSSAAPQLGGNDAGWKLASDMGHHLIPPLPALVQLCSDAKWVEACAGVKTKGIARLYANDTYITEKRGDLLFTRYGISGLAILDISREVSRRLAEYEACDLYLDLFSDLSKAKLTNLLLSRIQPERNLTMNLWLHGVLNKKLIPIILEQSRCQAIDEKGLNRKKINRLVHTLKNLQLPIHGTKGWEGAEVSSGGIDTQEVDPKTMESNIVSGLYFAGEILDVDGDRGGFNFHWAWVSGIRAGAGAALAMS